VFGPVKAPTPFHQAKAHANAGPGGELGLTAAVNPQTSWRVGNEDLLNRLPPLSVHLKGLERLLVSLGGEGEKPGGELSPPGQHESLPKGWPAGVFPTGTSFFSERPGPWQQASS
jgi:hypothetical protein